MSGYVIEIPQEKENSTIWRQQLRVAAYCRVSTPYEEQQKSLEKQMVVFNNLNSVRRKYHLVLLVTWDFSKFGCLIFKSATAQDLRI